MNLRNNITEEELGTLRQNTHTHSKQRRQYENKAQEHIMSAGIELLVGDRYGWAVNKATKPFGDGFVDFHLHDPHLEKNLLDVEAKARAFGRDLLIKAGEEIAHAYILGWYDWDTKEKKLIGWTDRATVMLQPLQRPFNPAITAVGNHVITYQKLWPMESFDQYLQDNYWEQVPSEELCQMIQIE